MFSLKFAEYFADFSNKNLQIVSEFAEFLLNVDQFFRDFPQMLHFGKMQHFGTPQGTMKVRKLKNVRKFKEKVRKFKKV